VKTCARNLMTGTVVLLGAALMLQGCSSSDDCPTCGPSEPTGLTIETSGERVQVTREALLTAVGADSRRFVVDWYVDGVLGGSDTTGVITQTNPATFTAPFDAPVGETVVVEARLASDSAVAAIDTLTVLFDTRYVDAAEGSDGRGDGRWTSPFKTITAALAAAAAEDTVHVLPGTYDEALGEQPPHNIFEGIWLRGSHRDSCIVVGSNDGACFIMLDGATVSDLTIRNPGGCNIGILSGFGGLIRSIVINDVFDDSAIRSYGDLSTLSTVVIEDCVLVNTQAPGTGRGFELIGSSAEYGSRATVRGCEISGWHTGMYLKFSSDPLVEHCEITDNGYGVDTYQDDVVTNPDFGEGARGSEGGNTILGNSVADFVNRTPTWIFARRNFWDGGFEGATECIEVLPGCDVVNTNGGVVEWCDCGPQ